MLAALRRRRLQRIAVEPLSHIEIVELLVPQHAGKGLALDTPHVLVADIFLSRSVEEFRFGNAPAEDVVEVDEGAHALIAGAQPDSNRDAAPGRHRAQIEAGDLGAVPAGIYRLGAAVDDVVMKCILEMAGRWLGAE